ncbi:MAG TPA: N-acetyl-gamma-glutamyl-phosphate reductase [Firmicutes bacterium]|nr:N-acetyl-gamma-glutamyl-phosphate reductase [Bacillota bacterium]
MLNVTVIGGSGYTGGEVLRILSSHPGARVVHVVSRTHAGKPVGEVFPNLRQCCEAVFCEPDPSRYLPDTDVVFCCAPHGTAMGIAREIVGKAKLIDLGPDFRFRDPAVFEEWYGKPHEAPELAQEAVYGLVELHASEIKSAGIVGNPGCYPTCSVLALAPLLAYGLIDPESVVIDAKSGVSGAGRSPGLAYHFPEVNDSIRPYGIPGHRHTPEIEQELSRLAGRQVKCSFSPHLVPMTRGILVTCYARLLGWPEVGSDRAGAAGSRDIRDTGDIIALYREYYEFRPFVRVLGPGELPHTKAVYGSNFCDVTARVDPRTGRVIAMAAIDNLVKGAAGQAVQNMNVMFGLDERTGLYAPGLYP